MQTRQAQSGLCYALLTMASNVGLHLTMEVYNKVERITPVQLAMNTTSSVFNCVGGGGTKAVCMRWPVSSSGLHRELSAGASKGKQVFLGSESSRPCTKGMDAFWTNCTSSCEEKEGRQSVDVLSLSHNNDFCLCNEDRSCNWKYYLWFGVKLIRKHRSPCVEPLEWQHSNDPWNEPTFPTIGLNLFDALPRIWPAKCRILCRS